MKPEILIAGIGNIFMGDDAFGSEVARRLLTKPWPEAVRVVDFGIRGFDLMFALEQGHETVILVDATPRGGAPGTLYTIEPDLSDIESDTGVETHGMNPMRVLATAKSLGARIEKVFVVGCEPTPSEGESMGLSEPVQRALDDAVIMVEALVERILAEDSTVKR